MLTEFGVINLDISWALFFLHRIFIPGMFSYPILLFSLLTFPDDPYQRIIIKPNRLENRVRRASSA